jgi:hypothetical protein
VKTSIPVEFHHQKKRLPALCARSIKSSVSAVNSLSIVSMRFLVNGPVSFISCVQSGFSQRKPSNLCETFVLCDLRIFFLSVDRSRSTVSHFRNGSYPMKKLHTVNAVIELGAGLALLSFPSPVVALLLGSPLDTPTALTVARVGGAGLLSLGIASWLARDDSKSRAARGLVAAMLFYDIAAVAILAFAGIGLGLHGVALWPAVVLHVVMTVWCVACLRRVPVISMTKHRTPENDQTRIGD